MRRRPIALACALTLAAPALAAPADPPVKLAPGVRGLVTRAPSAGIKVDGKVKVAAAEWGNAFCTPVHHGHARLEDRAAQFSYAWDDAASYVALRALDRHRADLVPPANLQDGDAVEFYLDTRTGPAPHDRRAPPRRRSPDDGPLTKIACMQLIVPGI
jgi:hypothetical protein